ncbi:hypothetical protein CPB83DRAFT_823547 [Crepidotus variabilis]|uniref:CxC2-like cysteine cluster KDZ transposase-associated domain-containing protein n=1 Tax=Crepidotus variabilis TaxID=179855 RepID=A0A9P6E2V0_9AGAR|nr:hypothetical protein CPB83DRAFT_823547 [Crepidotus variabilis]
MWCQKCVVKEHRKHHFHRIQKWNGTFFEKVSLKDLGLRRQLGHKFGETCLRPEPCFNDEFWVLDISGLHNLAIDFCGCGRGDQRHIVQLLRASLWPSTVTQPQSAATFRLLDFYEILAYESKVSIFEVYQTLVRLTNNTGLNLPNDRYHPFVRMVHEWLHLHMLVRAGRGHEEGGVAATKEGDLAVLCPPCPHPGINMDPDWKRTPADRWYRHAKFVSIDANFRLKRKTVSSHRVDPGLGKGWAYFVEETKYKTFLNLHQNEREPKSNCSRHDAVNLSSAKPNRGHAASGVGKIMCARHEMNLPNSVGDLQYGERYCNMDYMFYQSLNTSGKVQAYVVSYDIACQWSKKLQSRMTAMDEDFFLFKEGMTTKYLVPKFHLPAHVMACRSQYSFNYTQGVGRTDGEGIERGWNEINPLATSTREMGPGTRRDIIDAHFGDHNWRKTTSLGKIIERMFVAGLDMAEHVIDFNHLNATLPQVKVQEWTKEIEEWEMDSKKPNPFAELADGPTQATIRRELAEAETNDILAGKDFALDDNVSPAKLIATGIDLEAEQRSVKVEASKVWDHSRDRQMSKLQFNINTLHRKIDGWTKHQQLYCPGTERLRTNSINESNRLVPLQPYDFPLWLPSQIQEQLPVSDRLRRIEFRLREGQAHDSLNELRRQLQVRFQLISFKDKNSRGQGSNAQARNMIEKVQRRIDNAVATYKAAFAALVSLSMLLQEHGWKEKLKELRPGDVRAISQGDVGESEGGRTLSWIWKTDSVPVSALNGEDDGAYQMQQTKVEWSKVRARAKRFTEEVDLIANEMMRTVRYFASMALKWKNRGSFKGSSNSNEPLFEASLAYAEKTSAMFQALGSRCIEEWKDLPTHINRMEQIIANPDIALPGEFDKSSASKARAKAQRREARRQPSMEEIDE